MAEIVTRVGKGASLTHSEVDGNFNNLNAELAIVYMPGEIRRFAGAVPPLHWLNCEGQLLAMSEYPELYAAISTRFGGDGISSFALPEFKGTGGVRPIICVGHTVSQQALQVKIQAAIHGTAAGFYSAGTALEFFVQFIEPVTISGGTPSLNIEIGGIRHIVALSSSTSIKWIFAAYTIQASDAGDVVPSLDLNGAMLTAVDSNPAVLAFGYTPIGISVGLSGAAQAVANAAGAPNQSIQLSGTAQADAAASGVLN